MGDVTEATVVEWFREAASIGCRTSTIGGEIELDGATVPWVVQRGKGLVEPEEPELRERVRRALLVAFLEPQP